MYHLPLDIAEDIRSCASILSSSVRNKYLVKQLLDQEPEDIIWRIDPPDWYKNEAPPLQKLCPEYKEGSKPLRERRVFNLSVKSL